MSNKPGPHDGSGHPKLRKTLMEERDERRSLAEVYVAEASERTQATVERLHQLRQDMRERVARDRKERLKQRRPWRFRV